MPQTMQVPAWYDDAFYISQKVQECNVSQWRSGGSAFAEWTPDSVRAFMARANGAEEYEPWMGYENFVNFGNAENASPNPLFKVMEYCAAKAASLNGMNGGAGYDGNNGWTAESVLKYFEDHNITAWDHFTQYGQFENINPSNAMDLGKFLAAKAAQCNQMGFDNKSDWTADSVLAYFRDHGLNAVEVAAGEAVPGVIAVSGGAVVNPPMGVSQWGESDYPVDYYLTVNQEAISANAAAINFVATVDDSGGSTLNSGDQITGVNPDDSLTVNISSSFAGLGAGGFVQDISTVNVNNISKSADENIKYGEELVFNAAEITGVSAWNVNGNVDLENVTQTGITINYKDVDLSRYTLGFTEEATRGANDRLTITVDNVYYVERFESSGIEHFTVDARGEESYIRCFIEDMETLTITGDAKLGIRGASAALKSVDATTATGAVALCTRMANRLESFRGGSGDNSVSMQSMTTNCLIDGGDGNDTITLVNTAGNFKYHMTSIETLGIRVSSNLGDWMPEANIRYATKALFLDGSTTTGLENIALRGGNGWNFLDTSRGPVAAREITLSNYDLDKLNVNATTLNNVDLTIDTVENVTIKVGDNNADTADVLLGAVTLPDAKTVAINIAEIRDAGAARDASQEFVFRADVNLAEATSLSLNSGEFAPMKITGGDLSHVGELAVAGASNVIIEEGARLGQNAGAVVADASGLAGGVFIASFVDNSTGDATLEFTGSENGQFKINVDATYAEINITGGRLKDVLTIDATGVASGERIVVTGELGSEDEVIVIGSLNSVDFGGLANFDVDQVEVRAAGVAEAAIDDFPAA